MQVLLNVGNNNHTITFPFSLVNGWDDAQACCDVRVDRCRFMSLPGDGV